MENMMAVTARWRQGPDSCKGTTVLATIAFVHSETSTYLVWKRTQLWSNSPLQGSWCPPPCVSLLEDNYCGSCHLFSVVSRGPISPPPQGGLPPQSHVTNVTKLLGPCLVTGKSNSPHPNHVIFLFNLILRSLQHLILGDVSLPLAQNRSQSKNLYFV